MSATRLEIIPDKAHHAMVLTGKPHLLQTKLSSAKQAGAHSIDVKNRS